MGTNMIRIVLDNIEWLWWAILICTPPMVLIFFTLVYLRSFPHMSKQQRIWLGLLILSFYHFFFMIFIILAYKPTGSYFNIWLTAFEHLDWLF